MEIEKVRHFIRACVLYGAQGYISGLNNEDLICLFEECLVMAFFLDDNSIITTIYFQLGYLYENNYQSPKVIECYEKCLLFTMEIGDKKGEMQVCERLGNAYMSLGKYHEAIESYEKHLSIVTEMGDRNGEGSAYGNLGNAYLSLGKYQEAITYLETSLSIAMEVGDRQGEGNAYGNLGIAYRSLGKYHEAIKYYKKCLSIALEIGDRQGEGRAYGTLGNAYLSLDKYHEAIENYEKCLSIATEIGDRNGEGSAYSNLGNAYLSLGKYQKAIENFEKQLSIDTEIGDRRGEGKAYGNLGNAYHSLSKYRKAIEYYEKCLSIATEIGDRNGEGSAYGNLGNAYLSLGKYHEAIENYEKGLSIASEIGDRQGEVCIYGSLGNAYQSLGKYHEAIENYEKFLSIATEIGDRQGEGSAYGSLGIAYRSLGKYHEAIENCEKHLSIALEIGDRQGEGSAYGSLGNAHQSLGEYHEAIKYYEKHLTIAMDIGDRNGEGSSYGNLGNAYHLLGEYHEAIKYYEKRLSIATEIGDRPGEQKAHHNIGFCYFRLYAGNADHLIKSKQHLYKSIECSELLFDDLKEKDEFKISIFDTFFQSYKLLSLLCINTKQTEEALLVSELGRARALGDLLSLKYSVNNKKASKSGPLKLADVRDMMVPTSCVLFYDVPIEIDEVVSIWVINHREPLVFILGNIKTTESTLEKNEYDKDAVINLVKKSYDNMNVREGVDCEDRSVGILDGEKQGFIEKSAVSESPRAAAQESREGDGIDEKVSVQAARCIEDHEIVDEKTLELLFEALVAPVQDKLIEEEVVIIPDGPLSMMPFAALQDPKTGKFLSEMKRIRLSPSLTTLKLLQESSDDYHCESGALIVGNPEIGKVKFGGEEKSFCDLPGAEDEAKEIAKLLEVEPLTGRQATKAAVLEKLRVGVSVIHFAAHGSENGQILLAPSTSSATNSIPDEKDYVLTMQEAQESGLRAQLVVLSCCHSGRGEIKAEGVVGLTRAFLAAGARAVVASLWAIADDATKVFMLKFYSHLKKGESASKSLQQAMKEMRKTECYKEPRYWAAFFLIGDDVTITT